MELKKFKTEVTPLRGKLLNYARRLTENDEDAEDVAQEVLLKLWNMRGQLDQYNNVEAFAMRVTHNAAIDLIRSRKPVYDSLDSVQCASPLSSPAELLEEKDQMKLMQRLIEQLPPLQQNILRMKDIEGYESKEIAELTGCNDESIRSNLSRARRKLREALILLLNEQRRRNE